MPKSTIANYDIINNPINIPNNTTIDNNTKPNYKSICIYDKPSNTTLDETTLTVNNSNTTNLNSEDLNSKSEKLKNKKSSKKANKNNPRTKGSKKKSKKNGDRENSNEEVKPTTKIKESKKESKKTKSTTKKSNKHKPDINELDDESTDCLLYTSTIALMSIDLFKLSSLFGPILIIVICQAIFIIIYLSLIHIYI